MLGKIKTYLDDKEAAWRNSFGHDITDPAERKKSQWHLDWLDHGILRRRWHNFEEFAPGCYRSNQPDHARFEAYRDMGIKTILSLRGPAKQPYHLFEVESCEKLGLTMLNARMAARRAPQVDLMQTLFTAFEKIDGPFLMHCKSGADRTGLAAAVYLLKYHKVPIDVARAQLNFRFLHIRKSATGILDYFLDVYAARTARDPIEIEDWINTEYDREAFIADYNAMKKKQRFWQGWR